MKRLMLLTILVAMTTACKSTDKSTVAKKSVLMPANSKGMLDARNIAVVSVTRTGRHWYGLGSNVSNKLEAFLANVDVQGKRYFNVVDRITIEKIIKEQRIASNNTFDQATAVKLGRLIGADTLLTANFQISDNDSRYEEKQLKCIDHKDSNSKVGKALGLKSCEQYRNSTIYCTKRLVNVEFTPKATSVDTGKIVFAKTYTAKAQSSHCPNDKDGELKSKETLVRESFDLVFYKMRKDIAPYSVALDMKLIDKDKAKMPAATKVLFDDAMYFANENLFNRACNKFVQSAAIYSGSPAIMYNLGVCQELKGNVEAAMGYYDKALDLSANLSKDNKKVVIRAIKRHEGVADQSPQSDDNSDSTLDNAMDLVKDIGSVVFN